MNRIGQPSPILINLGAEQATVLERLRMSEQTLDEGWLQDLL